MTRLIAALSMLAVCLAAGPSYANDRIDNVDIAVMRGVAERLGHEITAQATLDNGTPIIQARDQGGLNYTLAGMACSDGTCFGMVSVIEFENDVGMDTDTVNRINGNWAAVKVVLHESTIEFSRYDVVDGGATTEGLAASLSALLDVTRTIIASFSGN